MAIKAGSAKPKTPSKTKAVPTAGAMSLGQKVRKLNNELEEALKAKGHIAKPKKGEYSYSYIEEVFDGSVVFQTDKGLFSASYTRSDDGVTVGDKVEVERRTVYEPKP